MGVSRILHHIDRGTTASPFISLTRSFGIAVAYALNGSESPGRINPAYRVRSRDRRARRMRYAVD